jgi:cytochrome oxidase Cu insertion factor (SCO1/SenC/PrrC family)
MRTMVTRLAFCTALGVALMLSGCAHHTVAASATADEESALPDLGPAAPLDLIDAVTGRPIEPSIAGKTVVLSFIASTCEDVCVITEAKFRAAQTMLARDHLLGSRVALVLVTVDPITDTPAVLRRLARSTGAVTGAFYYATGTQARVHAVLAAYGIHVIFHGPARVDPDHTFALLLLDAHHRIRASFATTDAASTIAHRAELLAVNES